MRVNAHRAHRWWDLPNRAANAVWLAKLLRKSGSFGSSYATPCACHSRHAMGSVVIRNASTPLETAADGSDQTFWATVAASLASRRAEIALNTDNFACSTDAMA